MFLATNPLRQINDVVTRLTNLGFQDTLDCSLSAFDLSFFIDVILDAAFVTWQRVNRYPFATINKLHLCIPNYWG